MDTKQGGAPAQNSGTPSFSSKDITKVKKSRAREYFTNITKASWWRKNRRAVINTLLGLVLASLIITTVIIILNPPQDQVETTEQERMDRRLQPFYDLRDKVTARETPEYDAAISKIDEILAEPLDDSELYYFTITKARFETQYRYFDNSNTTIMAIYSKFQEEEQRYIDILSMLIQNYQALLDYAQALKYINIYLDLENAPDKNFYTKQKEYLERLINAT